MSNEQKIAPPVQSDNKCPSCKQSWDGTFCTKCGHERHDNEAPSAISPEASAKLEDIGKDLLSTAAAIEFGKAKSSIKSAGPRKSPSLSIYIVAFVALGVILAVFVSAKLFFSDPNPTARTLTPEQTLEQKKEEEMSAAVEAEIKTREARKAMATRFEDGVKNANRQIAAERVQREEVHKRATMEIERRKASQQGAPEAQQPEVGDFKRQKAEPKAIKKAPQQGAKVAKTPVIHREEPAISQPSPALVTAQINGQFHLDRLSVKAACDDKYICKLKGSVSTQAAKDKAILIAKNHKQVRDVKDLIFIVNE